MLRGSEWWNRKNRVIAVIKAMAAIGSEDPSALSKLGSVGHCLYGVRRWVCQLSRSRDFPKLTAEKGYPHPFMVFSPSVVDELNLWVFGCPSCQHGKKLEPIGQQGFLPS